MLKVGITGGIGSGKTTVCKIFETLGVPVYYADERAKELMQANALVTSALKNEFGNDVYSAAGELDRPLLASRVFNQPERLKKLNAIVHPAVIKDAEEWMTAQSDHPYAIKEAALIFESGSDASLDYIIAVHAPEKVRIERIKKRDGLMEGEIKSRMKNQLDEKEKMERSDFIIYNDESQLITPQVIEIHSQLRAKSGNI